jgi:spermidine synthase
MVRQSMVSSRQRLLYASVLMAGAATMAVEMCASRLLGPYFGNSLPVWGVVIGLLLTFLAIGYVVGGRLADRSPRLELLHKLLASAGFLVGLVPYFAQPVLRFAAQGFVGYQAGMVISSLFSILALFALPVILLGSVSPFAIRLSVQEVDLSGQVAGNIYALSTLGSLLGTFGAVFWLIPSLGVRRTIFVVSLAVLITAIGGLLQAVGRRAAPWLLLLICIIVLQFLSLGAIKPAQGLVYEMDSSYNYIQVIQSEDSLLLKLNEGEGIQSSYSANQVLTGYVYDYFLLVPFFRADQYSPPVDNLCLIGLAGGTIANQYHAVYGPLPIDGVEIDPEIIAVARRFFGLSFPGLRVVAQDGRYFLKGNDQRYDVLVVDAYNPPYIPFQLTTVEFFRETVDHLTADGVMAINVARTETDQSLVTAIADTLKVVYPSVYVLDTLADLNSVIIASRQPTDLWVIAERLSGLSDPVLSDVAARASGRVREHTSSGGMALHDDHAPVEQIVHSMVARYLLGRP